MLHLMKKHQRWVYIVITVVVIISFSFFGTSGVIQDTSHFDRPALTAVDGTKVSRRDLEMMMRFIATDFSDHKNHPYVQGLNFLNDGALVKDVFSTGAAIEIIERQRAFFEEEYAKKLRQEKEFALYKHPGLEAISTENMWQYFIPQMKYHFDKMRTANDPFSKEYLKQKVSLYQGQKQFSAEQLRQILRYQQAQYHWVEQDPFLESGDLSLFGYHTLEDWFGKDFLSFSAAFIINSAKISEQRGFVVTKNEAYADLLEQNAKSFQESQKLSLSRAKNPAEHFQMHLNALHMDKTQAVEIWRQVLLTRKLFQNEAAQNIVSTFAWKKFQEYAEKEKRGTKYLLPTALRLQAHSYPLFETYVQTVSDGPLSLDKLPQTTKSAGELGETAPELLQVMYSVKMKSASIGEVLGAISSKELLHWELSDEGWETLSQEFAELTQKEAAADQRIQKLNSLDAPTRGRVDQFSRKQLLEATPTFISKALDRAPLQEKTWTLAKKGGKSPLENFSSSDELIEALHSSDGVIEKGGRYFLFSVQAKTEPQVATFAESLESGSLKALANRILQKHYKTRASLSVKPFTEVEQQTALSLYAPIVEQIVKKYSLDPSSKDLPKLIAHYRLRPYVENMRRIISEGGAIEQGPWSLEQVLFSTSKSHPDEQVPESTTLALNTFSNVSADSTGHPYFYIIKEEVVPLSLAHFAQQIENAQRAVGGEMGAPLAKEVVDEIQNKGGFQIESL